MSGVSRSPSGGDRAEAPGASHDSRSKGVRACHPFRAIVAAVPFRSVRRARPVAIQPCPAPAAPQRQVRPELLNSVIAMLVVQESESSGMVSAGASVHDAYVCQKMAQPVRQCEKVANLPRFKWRAGTPHQPLHQPSGAESTTTNGSTSALVCELHERATRPTR